MVAGRLTNECSAEAAQARETRKRCTGETEEMPEHIARYGRIVDKNVFMPGGFVHVQSALYKGPAL